MNTISLHDERTNQAPGFLEASSVSLAAEPVCLPSPGKGVENGKLTLKKENGAVKGFEYQCVCGHKDYFVCD